MIPAAASLFSPDESDGLVTMILTSGVVRTRRVSPGRVSEELAVRSAVAAERLDPRDIDAWSIRRVGDRRIAAPDDSFAEMMRRRLT